MLSFIQTGNHLTFLFTIDPIPYKETITKVGGEDKVILYFDLTCTHVVCFFFASGVFMSISSFWRSEKECPFLSVKSILI